MSKNQHVANTALRDLLSSVKIKTKREYRDYPNPFTTDLSKLGKDGEDHINISQHGNTELGRALANETPIPVEHPLFGKFRSVTGFWYYIKSQERNEKCRKLVGRGLKELSKTMTLAHVKNFRAIMLDTIWNKIKQNPAIGTVMIETDLPYECYYEDKVNNSRKRLNYAGWFVCGLQDMRDALIQGIEPDFREYLDIRGSDIYEFVPPMNIDDELRYLLQGVVAHEIEEAIENNPEPVVTEEELSDTNINAIYDKDQEALAAIAEPVVTEKATFSLSDNISNVVELMKQNKGSDLVEDSPDPYDASVSEFIDTVDEEGLGDTQESIEDARPIEDRDIPF